MFEKLQNINQRPDAFSVYTAESLWSQNHRARQMLAYHLNESLDVSSRNHRFIDQSTDWMVKHFEISDSFRVLDLGCGPGLYANRLARTGADVTGVDFSENSVSYARQTAAEEGLSVNYIHGNYLAADVSGKFDLVAMIMCDFCALGPAQRSKLLGRFSDWLAPRGKILLDVYSLTAFRQKEEAASYEKNQLNHFWYEEDYYCFCNAFKYEDEKVMLDKYTLYPQSGDREVVFNWLQCFDTDSLREELEKAGLRVVSVFSDVCGNAYDPEYSEFAVVAEKFA